MSLLGSENHEGAGNRESDYLHESAISSYPIKKLAGASFTSVNNDDQGRKVHLQHTAML